MQRIPNIWKDGNTLYFNGARGYKVMAKCIDKENFKINRLDEFCVLFHTSSKPEFLQYLRGLIKEHSLTITKVT